MGVSALVKGLASPFRARGYYRDQALDPLLNPSILFTNPIFVSSAATPYLSPTGMVQPVSHWYAVPDYDALRRYPNHYSAFQSAADHYEGYVWGWNGTGDVDYRDTFPGERNREETRVITDRAVYERYAMPYPCDDQPLLDRATVPQMKEITRYRRIGKKGPYVWRRKYHLLEGWERKVVMDYVYESVLTGGCPHQCPPAAPWEDCNQNGSEDSCDIWSGASQDCNRNGVPDDCEGIGPVVIRGIRPSSASMPAGHSITFIASAATTADCGPLAYRWSRDGKELKDGGAFSGAQTNKLTINPLTKADTGSYVVIVTNACGCSSTTFSTLTVFGGNNIFPDSRNLPGAGPDDYHLKRGLNIFSVWGGGSVTSPTLLGSVGEARFALLSFQYGRVLAADSRFALAYTFDAIPLAVASYPDFNVTRVRRESFLFRVEKVRRTVYGAGLSPLGLQLYLRPQSRIRPFAGASGGFLYFKDPTPKFTDTRFNPNSDFGEDIQSFSRTPQLNNKHLNLTLNFGGGLQVSARPRQAFTFGYTYHHFSNANRVPNDPGFDAHVFHMGYSFFRK